MNIPILPLSKIQAFAYQKCLIPRELFPRFVLPGVLAKCRDSAGAEFICNIYPMTNQQETNFCWLDDTIKVGSIQNSNRGSLTSLEILNTRLVPASSVTLEFIITDKLFEVKEEPSRELLVMISKVLMQPYTYVDNSYLELDELRNLGIAKIRVKSNDVNAFCITADTKIVVSDVKLQSDNEDYTLQKLVAMEGPRRELQRLIEGAAAHANMLWQVKPAMNALVVGPPGCGKTSLCLNFILENKCNSYIIRSANVQGQYPGETEAELRRIFRTVKKFIQCFEPNDPLIILIEDIDLVCPGSKNLSTDCGNIARISAQLISLLDHLHYTSESSKIIVLATTCRVEAINTALRRPGRFGTEINIPALNEQQRGLIFKSMLSEAVCADNIEITDDLVQTVAVQTQGFVGANMALLVQSIDQELLRKETTLQQFICTLERSLRVMRPAALQNTDVLVYRTDEKFDSIGGMDQLKKTLETSVLAGMKQKAAFDRFALCLPKGVLLYGPPGCAKTTFAKCLATEANMTFIPTSAAEVYSPYVGNSEKYMSKIFDTARKNSPCLVFLDEIDSLIGRRSAGANSDIQIRILSTLLTEMDGLGAKLYSPSPGGNTILVVAATNRPEMIDDALMRPGRFDKLIHVPPPDYDSRVKIMKIYSAKMPFCSDVNIPEIAKATENFSGADICNLCNEAAMHAFTENINAEHVAMKDFKSVLGYQKSSLTQAQIQWYVKFESTHKR